MLLRQPIRVALLVLSYLCAGCNGQPKMDYTLDLRKSIAINDVTIPKKYLDGTMYELPINSGKFIVEFPGAQRIVCQPERVFIKTKGSSLYYVLLVFPNSNREEIIQQVKNLSENMTISADEHVVRIRNIPDRPKGLNSFYEKLVRFHRDERGDRVREIGISVLGTGFKEAPLWLHWKILFHVDEE